MDIYMLPKYLDLIENGKDLKVYADCRRIVIGTGERYIDSRAYVDDRKCEKCEPKKCTYCKRNTAIGGFKYNLHIKGQICSSCVRVVALAVQYRTKSTPRWFDDKLEPSHIAAIEHLTFKEFVFTNARYVIATPNAVERKMALLAIARVSDKLNGK